jgi:predicted acetyltransferase
MSVSIVPARMDDKSIVANLLQLYLYDFSEFAGWPINGHGRFEYPYFDHYWIEDGRYPFLIQVDDELAGFAFVRTSAVDDVPEHHMAEFFVLRKFRRAGVGEAAARALFDRFPGLWSVSQIEQNLAAQQFWRQVIARHTQGQFSEQHDDRNHLVQRFISIGASRTDDA